MSRRSTAVSEAARMLAKLGASKGGKASAKALTPDQRKERARVAVAQRWKATKGDELPISEVAVLKRLSGKDKVTLRIAPGTGGSRRRNAIGSLVAKGRLIVLADLKDAMTIALPPPRKS
jgi:hypothetical protein